MALQETLITASPSTNEPLAEERIKPDDPASIARWTTELDVTAEQLNEAIAAVGDKAADVEMHLKGARSSTNADLMAAAGGEAPVVVASDESPRRPGDEATSGSSGTGKNMCPACGGTGTLNGGSCEQCSGTGRVEVGVGGA